MSESETTLGTLLAPDGDATRRLLEHAGVDGAFGALAREAVESFLPDVARELAARVREVLEVPVPEVLASAWGRSVELLKYRDPERYPPEKVSIVPLATHTVTSRHRPRVEVEVNGVLPTPVTLRLELEVELTAEVEGAKIAIQAGKIRKLFAGTVHLEGTLSFEGEEITSAERDVSIPGEIRLGDGIAIAPTIALGDVPIAAAPPAEAAAPPPPAGG